MAATLAGHALVFRVRAHVTSSAGEGNENSPSTIALVVGLQRD
jgi:hypothetical protein